jgi:predicted porin
MPSIKIISLDESAAFSSSRRDFNNLSKSTSVTINYAGSRFSANVKYQFRGKQRTDGASTYTDSTGATTVGYPYRRARNFIEIGLGYRLTKRLSLFFNSLNLNGDTQDTTRDAPAFAPYARMQNHAWFGKQYSLGIKGEF